MCNICGIVSEKFRPESTYWGKMCEYVTKSKSIKGNGCFASGVHDTYCKFLGESEYIVLVDGKIRNSDALVRSINLRGIGTETTHIAEIVFWCYILHGESCFKNFKGEFCIVIWDGYEKELIMIRDKTGINTLFYYQDGLRLAFASQIKGLFTFPFTKKELCDDIYCRLFALAGNRSPGETLFKNICEVPPGCYVKYKDFKVTVVRYHIFSLKDRTDDFEQTISGVEYLCKNSNNVDIMCEKDLTKDTLKNNIKKFVLKSDMPSPYVNMKTLSNMDAEENIYDRTGVFNIPHIAKLSAMWCRKNVKEFTNDYLSTLPPFDFKDEKDISKKEEIYLKQYIVLPQVVYAKRKACEHIQFPFLNEDVTEYLLHSLDYGKRIAKHLYPVQNKCNKHNLKVLKTAFYEMLSERNLMSGLIGKDELLKFTRLFPRPETMLYLIQVDIWLNSFL